MRYEFTTRDVERFWSFVDKTETCWIFRGTPSQRYGQFGLNGKSVLAHRFAYQIQIGDIPDGLEVLHHCDVMRCVRGDDLFAGTQQENIDDMMAKGRKPVGDAHWSRIKPEGLARGDRSGRHTHPERTPRGKEHWLALGPDTRVRGESHPLAKLTDEQVHEIRRRYAAGGISHQRLADEYQVHARSIGRIIHMKARRLDSCES